ncbi:MAG: DUF423 domain-containing protein [Planctomycetota bacterium]|jgi:hypothetical protein
MVSFDIEICSNCEWEIARSEQAYVFEGKIVCAECDNTLRSGPVDELAEILEPPAALEPIITIQSQSEAPSLSEPAEQEKANQSQDADKPIGFIIAGVSLFLIGVALTHIGLAGLAAFFIEGILLGIVLAGWLFILGMLILFSGIVVTVIAVISRQR